MSDFDTGRLLGGDAEVLRRSVDEFQGLPVDQELQWGVEAGFPSEATTLNDSFAVTGSGTFFGRAHRTLTFEPTDRDGWWFDRVDRKHELPIHVSIENVWNSVRNIVLRSGSPHNYMRLVEHIIALKVGMGLDNVMIRMDSGDPPLFDRASMDLVDNVDRAGIALSGTPARCVTVKEPVSIVSKSGRLLTFLPPEDGRRELDVDCAIDFNSAIRKQRIRFTVSPDTFRHGAVARTNATFLTMLYCKTFGKLFADTRNMGYTRQNVLVAGLWSYFNRPRLVHEGKALEAVWHRATLDLLAAVALIDKGRFVGRIISYKAGHGLDCDMVRELYNRDMLCKA
ncbi:MAG: UDP-3-O-acyl-N-acetylglucosamine deacetylase [Kiritimatiellae bacterium]|nr:UDP-3-O-acyl-N-acetylglucosamine deacetylase [Kiritimatiellia bacterium]